MARKLFINAIRSRFRVAETTSSAALGACDGLRQRLANPTPAVIAMPIKLQPLRLESPRIDDRLFRRAEVPAATSPESVVSQIANNVNGAEARAYQESVWRSPTHPPALQPQEVVKGVCGATAGTTDVRQIRFACLQTLKLGVFDVQDAPMPSIRTGQVTEALATWRRLIGPVPAFLAWQAATDSKAGQAVGAEMKTAANPAAAWRFAFDLAGRLKDHLVSLSNGNDNDRALAALVSLLDQGTSVLCAMGTAARERVAELLERHRSNKTT